MKFGFGKADITPRGGVELSGFGAFILRRSTGVRDRLWARAMAVEHGGKRMVMVSCDLIGLPATFTAQTRRLVQKATGLPAEAVMVHCTHTHSGPGMGCYIGWGEGDAAYLELLPRRIARACAEAMNNLQDATLSHAEVPCAGIGYNREYDKTPPPADALDERWRPAKPELTDTTCHVLKVEADGGDDRFCQLLRLPPRGLLRGHTANPRRLLRRGHEPAGARAARLGRVVPARRAGRRERVRGAPARGGIAEGAGGDCRAVRAGRAGGPRGGQTNPSGLHRACAARGRVHAEALGQGEAHEPSRRAGSRHHAPEASETDQKVRLALVRAIALRTLLATLDAGGTLQPPSEVQGFRLGPIALLAAPFEIFQAIKNEVRSKARSPIPLVMGITNDTLGYAVDHTKAAQGGYAADLVPLLCGALPFANVHDELVKALLDLDAAMVYG